MRTLRALGLRWAQCGVREPAASWLLKQQSRRAAVEFSGPWHDVDGLVSLAPYIRLTSPSSIAHLLGNLRCLRCPGQSDLKQPTWPPKDCSPACMRVCVCVCVWLKIPSWVMRGMRCGSKSLRAALMQDL